MQFDPLSEIFPLIEGDDFEELVQDIRRNGLEYPIVLYNGKILDGRNRYRACVEAGIEPEYSTYEGDDPLGKVISLNMTRRHLTVGQRALIAARLANMRIGRSSDELNASIDAVSQVDAATRMNVGRATVQRAKRVMRLAPQLVPAVERGDLTLNAAFAQTQQRLIHPKVPKLKLNWDLEAQKSSVSALRVKREIEEYGLRESIDAEILFGYVIEAHQSWLSIANLLRKLIPTKGHLTRVGEPK